MGWRRSDPPRFVILNLFQDNAPPSRFVILANAGSMV